jgi:hypothetical protein
VSVTPVTPAHTVAPAPPSPAQGGQAAPDTAVISIVCFPPGDPSRFEVSVDFESAGSVACGESLQVQLDSALHEASLEIGVPAGYGTEGSGACKAYPSGPSMAAPYGLVPGTCTVTVTREDQAGTLTIRQYCVLADERTLFNVTVEGLVQLPMACDEWLTTAVSPQEHAVQVLGPVGSPDSHRESYDTLFGGDCAAYPIEQFGAPAAHVTITPGAHFTCVVANVRRPDSGRLTVSLRCEPAGDPGRFQVFVGETSIGEFGCDEHLLGRELQPGDHVVTVRAGAGTERADYTTSMAGNCHADGVLSITAGELAYCQIIKIRK